MTASWWYANRAAGLVAWALLSLSMVVGLLLSSKVLGRRVRPHWLLDLHRGLSGLSVAFVAVHVAAAIADTYVPFGAADVLVPGASSWRPLAVAWGIVSLYLLLAVEGSSLLRAHLPAAVWRRLHVLALPLFLTATLHGTTAGTELGTAAGIAVAGLVGATVVGLATWRVLDAADRRTQPPTPRVPPRTRVGTPF